MIAMPEHIFIYNGSGQRCDMIDGPCACGAWHKVHQWVDDKRDGRSWVVDYIQNNNLGLKPKPPGEE